MASQSSSADDQGQEKGLQLNLGDYLDPADPCPVDERLSFEGQRNKLIKRSKKLNDSKSVWIPNMKKLLNNVIENPTKYSSVFECIVASLLKGERKGKTGDLGIDVQSKDKKTVCQCKGGDYDKIRDTFRALLGVCVRERANGVLAVTRTRDRLSTSLKGMMEELETAKSNNSDNWINSLSIEVWDRESISSKIDKCEDENIEVLLEELKKLQLFPTDNQKIENWMDVNKYISVIEGRIVDLRIKIEKGERNDCADTDE